jgi:hypothetical protein
MGTTIKHGGRLTLGITPDGEPLSMQLHGEGTIAAQG